MTDHTPVLLTVGEFVGFGVDSPGLSLAWRGNKRRTEAVRRALSGTPPQRALRRSAQTGGAGLFCGAAAAVAGA
jgi:hypothetical protein